MFHSLAMIAALAVDAVTAIASYIADALAPFFPFSEIEIEEEDAILPNHSAQIVETAETAKTGNETEIVKNDTEAKAKAKVNATAKIVEFIHGLGYLDRVQLHLTADGIITAILPIGTTKVIAIAKTDTVEVLAIIKNECITLLDIVEPIKIDFTYAYTKAIARVPKALNKLRDSQLRRAQAGVCTGTCTCTCTCTTCTNSSSATKAGAAICPRKVEVQRILDDFNGVQTKHTRTRKRTRKSKNQRKRESKSHRAAVRGASATATDQEHHGSTTTTTTCSTRPAHGRRCA